MPGIATTTLSVHRDVLSWNSTGSDTESTRRPGLDAVAGEDVVRTPGQEFAARVSAAFEHGEDGDVVVPFRQHLPAAFPLFASRPRFTVRHLLKTATVDDLPVPHVVEPPARSQATSGTSYSRTPEAAFASRVQYAPLTDLCVNVELPAGLLEHESVFASYLDYRVLVRLSVVENQSLLHGTPDGAITGLLRLPDARRRTTEEALEEAILSTAADVEETGGSCDGIVAHPAVYWQLVRTGLLSRLATSGITVSRTRMMPRDRLLLGDFSAAATLLLPNVASVALRRGAGTDGVDVIEARTRVGLAVHLPQHLISLTWGGGDV